MPPGLAVARGQGPSLWISARLGQGENSSTPRLSACPAAPVLGALTPSSSCAPTRSPQRQTQAGSQPRSAHLHLRLLGHPGPGDTRCTPPPPAPPSQSLRAWHRLRGQRAELWGLRSAHPGHGRRHQGPDSDLSWQQGGQGWALHGTRGVSPSPGPHGAAAHQGTEGQSRERDPMAQPRAPPCAQPHSQAVGLGGSSFSRGQQSP